MTLWKGISTPKDIVTQRLKITVSKGFAYRMATRKHSIINVNPLGLADHVICFELNFMQQHKGSHSQATHSSAQLCLIFFMTIPHGRLCLNKESVLTCILTMSDCIFSLLLYFHFFHLILDPSKIHSEV